MAKILANYEQTIKKFHNRTDAIVGTHDVTDVFDDVSIEMANDDLYWSDCKDVRFHSGFLQRAKEGMKWVQSVIEAEKPKKVILCGHSLGGAISGTHTFVQI